MKGHFFYCPPPVTTTTTTEKKTWQEIINLLCFYHAELPRYSNNWENLLPTSFFEKHSVAYWLVEKSKLMTE